MLSRANKGVTLSNIDIIFPELRTGPECSSCPLSKSPEGCMGIMALDAIQRVNDSYSELAARGDEASTKVQTRILGEAAAMGAFTISAVNETFARLQDGLNNCPGEIVVPAVTTFADAFVVANEDRVSKVFSTAAMRSGKPEPRFTAQGSSINPPQRNQDSAYHTAFVVNETAKRVLAAASPAFKPDKS